MVEKAKVPESVMSGRVVDIPLLSERDDKLFSTKVEVGFWRNVVLESVHSGYSIEDSKIYADKLLREYRKRNVNLDDI